MPYPDTNTGKFFINVYQPTSKKIEVANTCNFNVKHRDSLFKTATLPGSKTFNPFGRSVTLDARKKKLNKLTRRKTQCSLSEVWEKTPQRIFIYLTPAPIRQVVCLELSAQIAKEILVQLAGGKATTQAN